MTMNASFPPCMSVPASKRVVTHHCTSTTFSVASALPLDSSRTKYTPADDGRPASSETSDTPYYLRTPRTAGLVLGFARMTPGEIRAGVSRLAQVIEEMRASPA
jgi:hypothetical protein